MARELHEKAGIPFLEIFIDAPLDVVEARDPKGLYKKARAGEIKGTDSGVLNPSAISFKFLADFTGISAPYEAPESPELHIRTDQLSVADSVLEITKYLVDKTYI